MLMDNQVNTSQQCVQFAKKVDGILVCIKDRAARRGREVSIRRSVLSSGSVLEVLKNRGTEGHV